MSEERRPDDHPAEPPGLRLERVGGGGAGDRRALAAGLLIVAFLGLAVAKPWTPAGQDAPGGPAAIASFASPAGLASAASSAPPAVVAQAAWAPIPFVAGPPDPVPAAAVRAALASHDAWGIRAAVDATGTAGTPGIVERWTTSSPELLVSLDAGVRPVRALGLTAPSGLLVVDVRVSATVNGVDRWLDVESVAGSNPGSGVMLWPPRIGGAWASAWPAGAYRFEVLTAAGVGQLRVQLTGPTEHLTDPRPPTRLWAGHAVTGAPPLGAGVGTGVFLCAMAPGSGPADFAPTIMGLGGRSTAGLGYGSGWIDTVAGQASQVSAFGVRAYGPTAVSMGVVAPEGMRVDVGKLIRLQAGLATGPAGPADRAVGVVTTVGSAGSGRQAVRFDEPDGRAWEPGTYAILVDGMGAAGRDTVGYLVTLLPGSARTTAVPLAATRAWARFAGRWGVAAGILEPLDAPGRLAIRYAPTQPEAVIDGGADFTQRCLEVNLVDSGQPILGIGHPVGVRPGAVEVQRVYLDGSVTQPRPATALSVVPGLTIVAAPEGVAWSPGWYRLVVHTDTASLALPVCVGSAGQGYLAVPADAGVRPAGSSR